MTQRVLDRLAVVDMDADEPTVTAPYTARHIIKSLYWPLRRWDAEHRRWIVKTAGIRTLIEELRAAGYEVDVWRGGRMRTFKPTGNRTAVSS